MTISAVLLAGGESKRMGCDKATVEWRGRPLWEWQLEKLRALQPEKIFLSARLDPVWRPADVTLVLDAQPSRGPLSGLAATLAAARTDHVLVLAIDLPFMTAEYLRSLCALATEKTGAITLINGRAEPLGAIYPKAASPIFEEALPSGNYALQPIVARLIECKMLRVVPDGAGASEFYRNWNEPGDCADEEGPLSG